MKSGWRRPLKQISMGLGLAVLAVVGTGCDGYYTYPDYPRDPGNGGGYYDPYYRAWYDVNGRQCNFGRPMPGCNFYSTGDKIRSSGDPYYNSGYFLEWAIWDYTDSWGFRRSYSGYAWLSSSGILYDRNGYALNETDGVESRDWLAEEARAEKRVVTRAGKAFAARYQLSQNTGQMLARTLNDWSAIGKRRARTSGDVNAFMVRLYDVDLDTAKGAIAASKLGDNSKIEDLNERVARHWGTQVETSKTILERWYKDELSGLGVR